MSIFFGISGQPTFHSRFFDIVVIKCILNSIYWIRNFYAALFYNIDSHTFWFYFVDLQISDDDRMSLTTAVSDEDDGESVMASPYKAKTTGTAAASFNCTGAVRKAGWVIQSNLLENNLLCVILYMLKCSSPHGWECWFIRQQFINFEWTIRTLLSAPLHSYRYICRNRIRLNCVRVA